MFEKPVKVILCDYDFTLIDSSRGILACANWALSALDFDSVSYEKLLPTIGHSLEDTFTMLTDNSESTLRQRYREYYLTIADKKDSVLTRNTVLLPYAAEFIDTCQDNNITLGIVTNKTVFPVQDSLRHLGLSDKFSLIIGADSVKHTKPDPQGILDAISQLRCNIDEVLYIGDSLIDAITAQNANCRFIGITTGHTARDYFAQYPSIAILEDLSHLIESLSELETLRQ